MSVDAAPGPTGERRTGEHPARPRSRSTGSRIALLIGAFAFLFPFYYMIIGSLQKEPDSSPSGAFPDPSNLSLHNYAAIDSAISLGRSLVNSGIFTGGVIICTTVFGLLAGYALARLHFRGRGSTFALVLLVQVVPFQLLLIPLYVLIVRNYGLADSYLGMILPFAINTSAVFIFRQFFLQLPAAMFEAARIDGAGELQILFRIAVPLCKPAVMSVVLLSFTGPWNEFLWPFLVTKQQDMQPLAVSLANYISTVASAAANPYGAILAGACVLAAPAVALYLVFQSRFNSTDIDSATKG
ncbi:ABC-type glycerol-3-phosphate transport system permease component [Streptomyces sp. SAI-135]|jgi:multiple sugar transport system permease protein|uniref:carbohydrate ABC transporter permease n=1 Tax=unclassified Streptomyces TaxID=2593676 RepID=UPI0024772CA4|nr:MULTISPECIES: carbohydrate ABC transporter permease [unclassified Streptomyces]MDH6521774.1 ABC-type glycerol-3-phosphate transport system permease component [Streptomyces sp. SAI-090]MDH6614126.1 ABC-type glycerol-3-phosphate transport system permease component [Streptomyces sp. SAI-135]